MKIGVLPNDHAHGRGHHGPPKDVSNPDENKKNIKYKQDRGLTHERKMQQK